MKKLKIFILTLLMVITLLPVNTIAEGEQTTAPDVTVYATKEQMMDGTFAPNENGVPKNIGKIVFGKNADNNPQEWYILGKDTGVSGDNTVILAKTPIIKEMNFYDIPDQEGIVTGANLKRLVMSSNYNDCIYPEYISDDPEIGLNHYGTSDVRDELKKITNSSEKGYFSTEELKIMNSTVITTEDLYNNTSYTTEDKLYLPYIDIDYYDSRIKIGSDNQISMAYYDYKISYSYWLRTPCIINEDNGLYVNIGLVMLNGFVGITDNAQVNTSEKQYNHNEEILTRKIGVVPVGNLDLTNVLFASAAKAETTGKINNGTAMTLRFDASKSSNTNIVNMNLGNATVYSDHIEIARNSSSDTITLIVQGKNDSDNWSYSKDIPTDGSVNKVTKDDIIKELKNNSLNITDIDLENCKVWLETTDESQMVTYAVMSTLGQKINSVEIKDIIAPVAEQAPSTKAICNTTGVSNNTPTVSWTPDNNPFGYYTEYTANVILSAAVGYIFADTVNATVNGETAKSVNRNTDGTLTVTYQFDPTAKDIFDSIPAMSMEVDSADDINTERFPTEAEVIGKSGIVYKVRVVEWIKNSNNPLEYEGVLAPLPEVLKHNFNDGPATVKLTLTVKPAEVVPPATPEPSTKPTSTSAPVSTPNSVTDDGYVVPNTGVK